MDLILVESCKDVEVVGGDEGGGALLHPQPATLDVNVLKEIDKYYNTKGCDRSIEVCSFRSTQHRRMLHHQ